MLATVILASGPASFQIDPIEGSPDNLAIVRKWQDDPHSDSVIAQIPGTDAWMTICNVAYLRHPDFPVGRVSAGIEKHIAELPLLVEQHINGTASIRPTTLALARYLGIYTDEQMVMAQARITAKRLALDEEGRQRERNRQAKLDEEKRLFHESYHGFLLDRSPLQIGKIQSSLGKQIRSKDFTGTMKELIETLVSKGYKLENHPVGGRILIDRSTGLLFQQKHLSKTAFDYAEHLLNLR